MTAYPDTSFLYAIYRLQSNSAVGLAYYQQMDEPLNVTELLLFEFRQSLRLQSFRRLTNRNEGIGNIEFDAVLAGFERDLQSGIIVSHPCDLREVVKLAEKLSGNIRARLVIAHSIFCTSPRRCISGQRYSCPLT